MGGIFGLFNRDARPATLQYLEKMQSEVLRENASDLDCKISVGDCAGFGCTIDPASAGQNENRLPPTRLVSGFSFAGYGRVDNRKELGELLQIRIAELDLLSDADLLCRAYGAWRDSSPEKVYGNWAFAAWHPAERRLFLARDHFGYVSIYYYIDDKIFAFASSQQALLALHLFPAKLNEVALARTLVSWQGYDSESNVYSHIQALSPAHSITVTPSAFALKRFWNLEDTPMLRLSRREEYVEAFRDVFDESVRARITDSGPVCVTLSGGLDSGAISATAALLLSGKGERVAAFTSIPAFATEPYVGERFGDELAFARATAAFAGNIDHYPCSSADTTPIEGIRRALQLIEEPLHAAGNMFWILEIFAAARAMGGRTMLGGMSGNPGISWTGDMFSQPLSVQLRLLGLRGWGAARAKRAKRSMVLADPLGLVTRLQYHLMEEREWWRKSAIHPDFVRRLRLLDRLMTTASEKPRTSPLQVRLDILGPMRNSGAIMARLAQAHGMKFHDPTADPRVLAFTLSVPDNVFIDPASGLDRWLVREAMKGRLPEAVRLNRLRGRQSGDMIPRLRSCSVEVEAALNELSAGPAAEYLDVPYMRRVWKMIQNEDTPQAFYNSNIILNRGICAGLFVNGFFDKYGC